ncbi:golgin subfamily A member 2-like [Panicum miliaceum]|uniref:Golgin subfamily A member 2-like n=1 Tax=Panicum miliaceum TaxID=4540 RepID=A0A3L6QWF3_PANMI|nr:golgin subfamily A member 2-like [Panicum miliaceum]
MQAREEVTIAELAAASAEKEAASLRAVVERLQAALKIEKGERDVDKRRHEELARQVEAFRQEKLKLEEEIKALKASAAAATMEAREAAPAEAPQEVEGVWQAMAVAAAVGAASTAAFVLIFLRLKR